MTIKIGSATIIFVQPLSAFLYSLLEVSTRGLASYVVDGLSAPAVLAAAASVGETDGSGAFAGGDPAFLAGLAAIVTSATGTDFSNAAAALLFAFVGFIALAVLAFAVFLLVVCALVGFVVDICRML